MADRVFSVFAFFGFVLPLIPLWWHLEAWNSGTCYYIFWASLASLNQFVNSIVWAGNARNPAPIWCDISTRIMLGASVGIPAASLCINRRLCRIATANSVIISWADKRRAVLIDTMICVLFPIIFIAAQYVCQGHRFNIFEDVGCYPAIYNTLPSYFLGGLWPILLGLISAVYCTLSLRAFARRRAELNELLSSSPYLTWSRYFRLMALATTEIVCTTPLAIFVIYINTANVKVQPWISWEDTHWDFSRVEQIPAVLWRSDRMLSMGIELARWVVPACSFVFFAFFGFADEALRHYRIVFWAVMKPLGFTPKPMEAPRVADIGRPRRIKPKDTTFTVSMPLYVPGDKSPARRSDSLASSDEISASLWKEKALPPIPTSSTASLQPPIVDAGSPQSIDFKSAA